MLPARMIAPAKKPPITLPARVYIHLMIIGSSGVFLVIHAIMVRLSEVKSDPPKKMIKIMPTGKIAAPMTLSLIHI